MSFIDQENPYKTYIGVKIVDARPMTLLEHNIDRGEVEFAHEDDDLHTPGYQVRYETGYISWSPKEPFEKANRQTALGCMAFGMAVEAAKKGDLVMRESWPTPRDLVFICPHALEMLDDPDYDGIEQPYLSMVTDTKVQTGWAPTQGDILADDWMISTVLQGDLWGEHYEEDGLSKIDGQDHAPLTLNDREIAPVEASVRSDDHE